MNKTTKFGILLATSSLAAALLIISMTTPFLQLLKPAIAQDVDSMIKDAMTQLNETRMALQEQNDTAAMTHLNQIENDLIAITLNGTTTSIPSENQTRMDNGKNLPTNTIQLNTKEKKGVYSWVNKDGTNPVLTFKLSTNNVVQIKNPTDSKHDLVITSGGKEVVSSGDIIPGKSGKLTFASLNQAEPLEYHCEYHPTTMKGTITISP